LLIRDLEKLFTDINKAGCKTIATMELNLPHTIMSKNILTPFKANADCCAMILT
jgi:hypothetical protein